MTNEKLQGLVRLRLNAVMNPFCIYGLDVHIPPAVSEILEIMEFYYKEKKGVEDAD